jgi:hypothetical protein
VILDITAEYIPDGDTILAEAYVLDEIDDVFHPELVASGTATVTFLGTAITKLVAFDKRMGNSDGAFKFTFSHPPKIKNLQFKVDIVLVDTTALSRTVAIRTDGEDEIPLASNVLKSDDFRSQKRKDEGL